jgi:hypothetical protein
MAQTLSVRKSAETSFLHVTAMPYSPYHSREPNSSGLPSIPQQSIAHWTSLLRELGKSHQAVAKGFHSLQLKINPPVAFSLIICLEEFNLAHFL